MKSYKEIEKKHTPEEIAESVVFPGTKMPKKEKLYFLNFATLEKAYLKNRAKETKQSLIYYN